MLAIGGPGKPISFYAPGHTPGMLCSEGIYRPFHLLIYVSQSSNERAATVNSCVFKTIQDCKCLLRGVVIQPRSQKESEPSIPGYQTQWETLKPTERRV